MQELDKSVKKKFTRSDGPFVRALDQALASFHVERQAYYSGTFVGNHVHSCLKVNTHYSVTLLLDLSNLIFQPININKVCDSVPSVAAQHCPALVPEAQAIAETFREAFTLFSKCHNTYERNYVSESERAQLCKAKFIVHVHVHVNYTYLLTADDIKKFMAYYRCKFPNASVTPKMHFLEEHVVEWINRWKVGFGLLGEQGAESIHAYFNTLRRTYSGIPDRVKRLKHMMTEHILHVAPDNITTRPSIKRKKKAAESPEE